MLGGRRAARGQETVIYTRGYGEAQSAGPREREIAVNLTTKAGAGRKGPIASSD